MQAHAPATIMTRMRRRLAFVLSTAAVCAFALGACSPTWNWRELRLEHAPIRIQLPCKPEQASRRMPLAGEVVDLNMTGCATQGMTFAVTSARLDAGASPAAGRPRPSSAISIRMAPPSCRADRAMRPVSGLPAARRCSGVSSP